VNGVFGFLFVFALSGFTDRRAMAAKFGSFCCDFPQNRIQKAVDRWSLLESSKTPRWHEKCSVVDH